MYDRTYLPITALCLNVTDNCNFNCRYCFVHKKPNNMSLQVANDAIEWLRHNQIIYNEIMGTDHKLEVFFFGGEPTLRWDDLIVPIVEQNSDIDFSITTNGYLLDEAKIDFLANHDISIMFSMDGDQATQDYNRQFGSFEKLDENLRYAVAHLPDLVFRGTIIPETCGRTFDNIYYAYMKGLKNCYFTIDIFEPWDDETKALLEREIKKYAMWYANSIINNRNIINFTPFTEMISLIIHHECGLCYEGIDLNKCGLGNGYGAVDYQGNIFTCQEAVTIPNNDIFKIGSIYEGFDFDAAEKLSKLIIDNQNCFEEKCNNCSVKFACKQKMCQVNNHICSGDCLKQSSNQCWWQQLLYKYSAWVISFLQNVPNFQKYMESIILKEGYNGCL